MTQQMIKIRLLLHNSNTAYLLSRFRNERVGHRSLMAADDVGGVSLSCEYIRRGQ